MPHGPQHGSATGLTTGRATGIFSLVREYLPNGTHETSTKWSIFPHSQKSGAFSAPGNSSSVGADGSGRVGGMITGDADKAESLDVSDATPFYWLLPRVRTNGFPDAHLYPIVA